MTKVLTKKKEMNSQEYKAKYKAAVLEYKKHQNLEKARLKKLDKAINIHRQKMGMVLQHFNVFPHLNVLENITLAPVLTNKMNKEEAEIVAKELLEKVGLKDKIYDYPKKLSGGQKQRLAIARALAMNPKVMLFDEPHTGLDQDACTMLDTVLQEVAARGRTVVMTSHDLTRIADLASRYDVLSRGVIVASAQRSEVGTNQLLSFYRQAIQDEGRRG